MSDDKDPDLQIFGAEWTEKKLDAVKRYLDAYTTVLKKQSYELIYIDLFAGTGFITTKINTDIPMSGSAAEALCIDNKKFDKFIFAEVNSSKVKELEKLRTEHPDREIEIYKMDANDAIKKIHLTSQGTRGVIFLDPFGAQVTYNTIRHIADLECLDAWILFPISTITRMLNRRGESPYQKRLTSVFGDERWKQLYNDQPTLDDDTIPIRSSDWKAISALYKELLKDTFGDRYLDKSLILKNGKGSPLFELVFCTGSTGKKAILASHRIAKHIIDYETYSTNTKTDVDSGQQTLDV